jgi:hypothetical protein
MILTSDTTTPMIITAAVAGGVIVALVAMEVVYRKKHPQRKP